MKLWELPRDKKIKLYGLVIDAGAPKVIIFGHIDGNFSYCWLKDEPDKIIHLYASTEIKKYKDGYKIV